MNIIEDFIPLNTPKNRRPAIKRKVESIVVHNTANPKSTAINERAWLTNTTNNATASFNYVVDEHDIIQCIPDNEVTWNAGDGGQGEGNVNGLSVEICDSGNYKANEDNAVKFIAKKLIEHRLTINDVHPHKYFSGKNCPHIILPYWPDFIARIQAEYNRITVKEVATMETPKQETVIADWKLTVYQKLIARGIKIDEMRLDETITRAEVFALADKVLTYLGK